VWPAASADVAGASGSYYMGFQKDARVHPHGNDRELAAHL